MFAAIAAILLIVAALITGGALDANGAVFLYLGLAAWALHFAFLRFWYPDPRRERKHP
jgi:hypothetical protein